MSNSNIYEHIANNYDGKYFKIYETENKPLKRVNNYENKRSKRGTYISQVYPDENLSEYYYHSTIGEVNSFYTNGNEFPREDNNINKNKIKNYKNRINNTQQTNNDIKQINTITYYSVIDDNNKGRSTSSNKLSSNIQNTLNNQNKSRIKEKNDKNTNYVEIDNKYKNNGNLLFFDSNKNYKNNNFNSIVNDENKEKIVKINRRKKRNEVYISDNRQNIDKLNEKKYNHNSIKINNNKIMMSGFEISYESDKGERNTYNNYKKYKNNIITTTNYSSNSHNYNNIYYSNINSDDNKNNICESIHTESNNNNQKNNQHKHRMLHNNSSTSNNLSKNRKRRNNINEPDEVKDLNNNKSVSIVTSTKKKNIKSSINITNSNTSKQNNSNIPKINILNRNKNSLDMNISNNNSNTNIKSKKIIKKNDINSNLTIENPIVITSESTNNINKKNSNDGYSYHNNTSRGNKKSEVNKNRGTKPIFKIYHRKSDIKKITLIQSIYRAHLLNSRLNYNNKIYQLLQSISNTLYIRKVDYWKDFINKIYKMHKYKKLNNKSSKDIKKSNSLLSTNNKLILKAKEVNMLHKELGDSFNIINDNSGLKLKLDDMIKENTELKNQICDNKNIEEKLKQLIVENKRNQNINAIIMKDNQQLAKRLKTIQDNRNNQLVIQYQKSFDFGMEDNLQFQSSSKLKYLYLKCLVFKKILKNRNLMKTYFNKYKNNAKKIKTYKIENNNIFIDNKKKINIQMAKNFNINFISQNDNYKQFFLYKLFIKKEKEKLKMISKFFYKFFFIAKNMKFSADEEKKQTEKEKEIIKNKNEQKKNILQSIIDKYERNYIIMSKSAYREWRLRSVIFKMKGVAKEIKRKKKLKKKIRDKIAKETLNNLKNKTAKFQSAHEFSYKIDKINNKEMNNSKAEENKKEKINTIKEEDEKIENNVDEQEDSGDSLGLDD